MPTRKKPKEKSDESESGFCHSLSPATPSSPMVCCPFLSSWLLQVGPACSSKEGIIQNDFIAGCVEGGPSPTPVLQTKRGSTTWIPLGAPRRPCQSV